MSGFSTTWLDLREPVDHAARDDALLRAVCSELAEKGEVTIVDLGCGTGSTVRALSRHLSSPARWRLVDNDDALLAAARERLAMHEVSLVEADLRDIAALPLEGADIVTASALFDLVSRDWLEAFASALELRGIGLYAALNYDGFTRFEDAHPADGHMLDAFNAHQLGDKGFGPALGPTSPAIIEEVFGAAGFTIESAESPWVVPAGELQRQLVEGLATAVRETGLVQQNEIAAWLAHRSASGGRIWVGHRDVFARPVG